MRKKVMLNLGCGHDYMKGFINCDSSPLVNPDWVVDLEKPLPFTTDSVDYIVAYHVFEHIHNFIPLMHELYRVGKDCAQIHIKVPFYSSWGQYNDPTHVRFFTPYTFDYFSSGNYSHETGVSESKFLVEKVKLNFGVGKSSSVNRIMNPLINLSHRVYCRFFAWIIPCAEIEYTIRIIKKPKSI